MEWEGLRLTEGEWGDVVGTWLVVKVAGLEWRVEADFGDGYRWVLDLIDGVGDGAVRGYHVLAFEAAAVDAGCEGAGSVPWGGEGVVAALELREPLFRWTAAVG